MHPEAYTIDTNTTYDYTNRYDYTYSRKRPKVEVEVVDETVEEWEEEREDGTKIIVRKRTTRTKSTTTRDMDPPNPPPATSGTWTYGNKLRTYNGINGTSDSELLKPMKLDTIEKLMKEITKPFTDSNTCALEG